MKSAILFTLWAFFSVVDARQSSSSFVEHGPPVVAIFYASTFDGICTAKTAYKIDPAWVVELKNQLPRWRQLWDQEGVLLLKTTTKLVNRAFVQKNFQLSLSLCSFPSMSAPLIINTRYALRSFTEKPVPEEVLISTMYHELLHNFLDSFLPAQTPLLTKYKHESKGVLNHLHLFALEKAVYVQLGWESTLKEVISKDESLPNKDYKRAWEIINKEESDKDFVAELRLFSKGKSLLPYEI